MRASARRSAARRACCRAEPVRRAGPWLHRRRGLAGRHAHRRRHRVAGGLVGVLTHVGVPAADAAYYNEGVRRGGTLVAVRAEDSAAKTVSPRCSTPTVRSTSKSAPPLTGQTDWSSKQGTRSSRSRCLTSNFYLLADASRGQNRYTVVFCAARHSRSLTICPM